jgi:hypothetical protein
MSGTIRANSDHSSQAWRRAEISSARRRRQSDRVELRAYDDAAMRQRLTPATPAR